MIGGQTMGNRDQPTTRVAVASFAVAAPAPQAQRELLDGLREVAARLIESGMAQQRVADEFDQLRNDVEAGDFS